MLMKKMLSLTLLLFISAACSNDDGIDSAEAQKLATDRMEENAVVVDESIARTTELFEDIGPEAMHAMVASKTRDEFVKYMLQKTSHIFDETVNDLRAERQWQQGDAYRLNSLSSGAYLFKSYLDLISKGIDGTAPGQGVLDQFSASIDREIEERGGTGEVHIESFSWGLSQTGAHTSSPVTLGAIAFVKEELESIIMLHEDEDDVDQAIDEFVADHNEHAVLIGLLVPAIQGRMNNAAAGSQNNLKQLLLASHNHAELILGYTRSEWLQVLRRAILLAGVYVIIQDNFDPQEVDFASITPQRTMYEALSVLIWVSYYDGEK